MNPESPHNPTAEPRRGPGRPLGSTGTRVKRVAEIVERLKCDPLEVLLKFARDENLDVGLRLQAASRAVGFVHPRLSTVAVGVESNHSHDIRLAVLNLASDPATAAAIEQVALALATAPLALPDAPPSPLRLPSPITIEKELAQ